MPLSYGQMKSALNKLPKNYVNLFNYNFIVKGRYYKPNTTTPTLVTNGDLTYGTVGLSTLVPGQTYTLFGVAKDFTFAYNGNGVMTPITSCLNYSKTTNAGKSGLPSDDIIKFTVPADCVLMCITVRVGLPLNMLKPMMYQTGDTINPITYVPYGSYHIDSLVVPRAEQAYNLAINQCRTRINVKADGTGDFTSFVQAIKSIGTSSELNQYDVFVYDSHDILTEMGGQTFCEALTSASDRVGLLIPAYVNIIGIGKPTLSAKILSTWNCDGNAVKAFSILELTQGNNKIKNIKLSTQNTRYAIHDESNGSVPNSKIEWEDCEFVHLGNDDFSSKANPWISASAYGSGSSSGNIRIFNRCKFTSKSFYPFLNHDNANFVNGVYLEFNGCEFYNQGGNTSYSESAKLSTYSDGTVENTACFRDCILTNIAIRNEVNGVTLNRWRVIGGGNVNKNMSNSGIAAPFAITI